MIEYRKSQEVRLADVFLIGPFMVWVALRGRLTDLERLIMGVLGAATIAYNLYNYRRNQKSVDSVTV
jgi:hypothetical protein